MYFKKKAFAGGTMKIQGFQKLTLLDYPGKTAATIFTGGCNFRCPFCHNSQLVLTPNDYPEITQEEILCELERRSGFIDGVCITGGEPLLWNDITPFVNKIKELGLLVKIDTNGSMPLKLQELLESGNIDYVAMDIKNSLERYAETVGIVGFDVSPIVQSVQLLKEHNTEYEFRTTVVKELHSESDIESIGKWLQGEDRYFLQSYKLSDGVIDKTLSPHTPETMREFMETARKYLPNAELRGI